MKLGRLDHVNVRTANLATMISWYESVLGMENGDRPPFPFPGAWLYAEGSASVHLVGVDAQSPDVDDLQLEHFAFQASGFELFKAHLTTNDVSYEEIEVPGIGVTQLNMWDPDGNHIHIDFEVGKENTQ